MRSMTRHLADDQQRSVTKLHLLARLNRQRSHLLGLNLRDEFSDAACYLDTVLVELRLPEQASEHRPAKLMLRGDMARRRALVSARLITEVE